MQNSGFSPYTGQQVADFSPQQQSSFGMGSNIANAAQPNVQGGANALSTYLNNAGNQPTVNPETISSQMSPYMNQYVNMALQPQLKQAANAYMLQSQAQQGNATSAGAFGDPREAQAQTNLGLSFGLQNQGLVGNAYNAAFNTAIGAGAQDVSNNLNAQTTNAGLYNTGLNELLAGSNAGFSQGTGAANLQNTFGAQQTAQSQAGLNAQYNQWLMAQQYPFQTAQLMNSTISAATPGAGGTSTTQAPNNAGWGIVGSLAGSLPSAIMGGIGGMGGPGTSVGGGKADGGDIPGNQPTLIGERGPELFAPHQSGTVIPYEKLKEAIAKKQGISTKDVGPSSLDRQLGVPAMADGGMFAGMVAPSVAPPAQNNAGAGFGGGIVAPPPAAPVQNNSFAPAPAPVNNMQPAMPMPQAAQAPAGVTAPPPAPAPNAGNMMPAQQQPQMNPAVMQRFQQFMQQRGQTNPQQAWSQFMQQYGGGNLNNSFGIAA